MPNLEKRSFCVDTTAIRIYVRGDHEIVEKLDFRTKRQADQKLSSLMAQGYKFDRYALNGGRS